jgi:hypothetical protein
VQGLSKKKKMKARSEQYCEQIKLTLGCKQNADDISPALREKMSDQENDQPCASPSKAFVST